MMDYTGREEDLLEGLQIKVTECFIVLDAELYLPKRKINLTVDWNIEAIQNGKIPNEKIERDWEIILNAIRKEIEKSIEKSS